MIIPAKLRSTITFMYLFKVIKKDLIKIISE